MMTFTKFLKEFNDSIFSGESLEEAKLREIELALLKEAISAKTTDVVGSAVSTIKNVSLSDVTEGTAIVHELKNNTLQLRGIINLAAFYYYTKLKPLTYDEFFKEEAESRLYDKDVVARVLAVAKISEEFPKHLATFHQANEAQAKTKEYTPITDANCLELAGFKKESALVMYVKAILAEFIDAPDNRLQHIMAINHFQNAKALIGEDQLRFECIRQARVLMSNIDNANKTLKAYVTTGIKEVGEGKPNPGHLSYLIIDDAETLHSLIRFMAYHFVDIEEKVAIKMGQYLKHADDVDQSLYSGYLAERQGDFKAAAKHYLSASTPEYNRLPMYRLIKLCEKRKLNFTDYQTEIFAILRRFMDKAEDKTAVKAQLYTALVWLSKISNDDKDYISYANLSRIFVDYFSDDPEYNKDQVQTRQYAVNEATNASRVYLPDVECAAALRPEVMRALTADKLTTDANPKAMLVAAKQAEYKFLVSHWKLYDALKVEAQLKALGVPISESLDKEPYTVPNARLSALRGKGTPNKRAFANLIESAQSQFFSAAFAYIACLEKPSGTGVNHEETRLQMNALMRNTHKGRFKLDSIVEILSCGSFKPESHIMFLETLMKDNSDLQQLVVECNILLFALTDKVEHITAAATTNLEQAEKAIQHMQQNLFYPMTAKQTETMTAQFDAARKAAEEEAERKKAEEDAERKKAEEEAERKKAEEDAERKKAEEEAERKKAEEEAAKKAEEEAERKKAEEDAERKKAEEEAERKKAEEDAERKKAEEEAERKKAEEEAERKKAEEEAERKKAEEEAERKKAEEEAQRKLRAEAAAARAKQDAAKKKKKKSGSSASGCSEDKPGGQDKSDPGNDGGSGKKSGGSSSERTGGISSTPAPSSSSVKKTGGEKKGGTVDKDAVVEASSISGGEDEDLSASLSPAKKSASKKDDAAMMKAAKETRKGSRTPPNDSLQSRQSSDSPVKGTVDKLLDWLPGGSKKPAQQAAQTGTHASSVGAPGMSPSSGGGEGK